jgi:hypothetical protein
MFDENLILEIYKKILSEEIKSDSSKDYLLEKIKSKVFEEILYEQEDILEEGIKIEMAKLWMRLAPMIVSGCNATTALQKSPTEVKKAVKEDPASAAVRDIKSMDKLVKELYKSLKQDNENHHYIKRLIKIFGAIKSRFDLFDKFKDNTYLMSVYVTSIFASDKKLYQNLGDEEDWRVVEVTRNERFILFHECVVLGKEPDSANLRTKSLTDEEKQKVQSHPLYKDYEKVIGNIVDVHQSGNIILWSSSEIADAFNNEEGKVFWCGAFVASILALAGEAGLGHFGSTFKMEKFLSAENINKAARDKEIAIFNHKYAKDAGLEESEIEQRKIDLISPGMIVLYGGQDGSNPYHFGLVLTSPDSKGEFYAAEGNTHTGGATTSVSGEGDSTIRKRLVDDVGWIVVPRHLLKDSDYIKLAEAQQAIIVDNNFEPMEKLIENLKSAANLKFVFKDRETGN